MTIDGREILKRLRRWAYGPDPKLQRIDGHWFWIFRDESGRLVRIKGADRQ